MSDSNDDNFSLILIYDVNAAMTRRNENDTQASRRDLIRSVFAAIEGLVWIFREEVIDAAVATYGLEDDERIVLEEKQHIVSDRGKIMTQSRFLSLTATIRLVVRIANRITHTEDFDFSDSDWDKFRDAVTIRNRITHPKSIDDLRISETDIDNTLGALFWFLEKQAETLTSVVRTRKDYLGRLEDVLNKLKMGDPEITSLYQALRHQEL